jgi:hypothetical protein
VTTQIGSNPPSTDTASGDVSYDLAAGTFTVSSSDNTGTLSDGDFNFLVLGSGVVLADAYDREITYYLKQ